MRLYVLCTFSLGLAACAFEPTGSGDPGDPGDPDPGIPSDVDAGVTVQPPVDPTPPDPPPPPPPPPEPATLTCRVEGENLGVAGVKVEVGSRTYTFESWQTSAAGAVIGFTLVGPTSNLRYEVRADGERFMGDSLVYTGDDRITRVDFCVSFGSDDD